MKKLMTGNEAAALAARLAAPQVVAAYPITPQTSIAEKLAEYAARGEMQTRYIKVESETSALAACIGGSLAGARVFTATSSQGLALMHELLHWAAGARLPIVVVNVNRSMAAPWSLGVDHNDTLSQRDTGCMQIYCETAQEVFDTILIAFKLSEAVLLPILVCMDGFLLSHYTEPVDIPEPERVRRFLPRRRATYRMDPGSPCTFGGGVTSQVLYELRQRMQADHELALRQMEAVGRQFERAFGRRYRAVDTHGDRRARLAVVTNGTMAGTVKAFIKQGGADMGVGLVKLRAFRPFPRDELRRALSGFERAIVIDRNLSPGSGGIIAQELKACFYDDPKRLPIVSVIGGLGGVDVTLAHLDRLIERVRSNPEGLPDPIWMEV